MKTWQSPRSTGSRENGQKLFRLGLILAPKIWIFEVAQPPLISPELFLRNWNVWLQERCWKGACLKNEPDIGLHLTSIYIKYSPFSVLDVELLLGLWSYKVYPLMNSICRGLKKVQKFFQRGRSTGLAANCEKLFRLGSILAPKIWIIATFHLHLRTTIVRETSIR